MLIRAVNIKCFGVHSLQFAKFSTKCRNLNNMKYLNVAEKNDAAKTIAGQLSHGTAKRREGYSVYNKIYEFDATVKGVKSKMVMTSVSGHLLKLEFLSAYRSWQHVDPLSLFEAPVRKSCAEDFLNIKRTLEREIRSCQGLIIWTDCDREGENIGFEIINVCCAVKPNIAIYRAIFSEITSASVRNALQNLKVPDKLQSNAVDVRTELDLRTGAAITRFQTMRLQRLFPENIGDKLISYGSCQIPTLGFVVERYKEIEAFVSEPFWKIKVTHCIDDLIVEFHWSRNRLFDRQTCEDYYLIVVSNPIATVESIITKPKSKYRPIPMDTVELQKLGSKKLKLPAKEVMTIAEKLYTKGIISYPRTDTNMFSKDIDLRSFVEQQRSHSVWGSFAERVLDWGINPRNGNKTDHAHPPIHPTKIIDDLTGKERQVYELICRHFLACVSKDAIGSETVVNIIIEGEKFSANGLVIHERNYLDVYVYDQWKSKEIHNYETGQTFQPTEITMPEGRTTAPALLTEADLIALMEKHGIGTDATYAEHINTIKERQYIGVVDKGYLLPGVIGMGLYEGYDAMKLPFVKPFLRAEFEADLKLISLGEKQPEQVLVEQITQYKEAYKQFVSNVTIMDDKMSRRIQETPVNNSNNTNVPSSTILKGNSSHIYPQELLKCPKCSTVPMVLKPRKNQNHFYIGCLNYPECKNTIWLPDECSNLQVLDEYCAKCGSSNKLLKMKLTNSYHRFLFKTPTGCYKTCLACDVNFRNTFNINADCVKKTGNVVIDSVISTNNELTTNSNGFTVHDSANDRGRFRNGSSENTVINEAAIEFGEVNGNKKKKRNQSSSKASSSKRIKTVKSTKTKYNDENLRRELQELPLYDFFDSNDSFNDIMNNSTTVNTITTLQEEHTFPNGTNSDLLTNDEEVQYRQYQGTIPSQGTSKSRDSTLITNKQSMPSTSTIYSASNLTLSANETELQTATSSRISFYNSTQARNKNNVPPNCKEPQQTEDGNYIWGTRGHSNHDAEVSPGSHKCLNTRQSGIELSSQQIKCNKCHQPVKLLTVKKDGPTKGRQFYICSQKIACKYFQWADEVLMEQNTATSESNADGSNSNNSYKTMKEMKTNEPVDEINCSCNQRAISLTVSKEGVNKGRRFYVCANRNNSCNFFKWADKGETTTAIGKTEPASYCWGTMQKENIIDFPTSSSDGINVSKNKKKANTQGITMRKCGLCRQEGHIRRNCPQRQDFDN